MGGCLSIRAPVAAAPTARERTAGCSSSPTPQGCRIAVSPYTTIATELCWTPYLYTTQPALHQPSTVLDPLPVHHTASTPPAQYCAGPPTCTPHSQHSTSPVLCWTPYLYTTQPALHQPSTVLDPYLYTTQPALHQPSTVLDPLPVHHTASTPPAQYCAGPPTCTPHSQHSTSPVLCWTPYLYTTQPALHQPSTVLDPLPVHHTASTPPAKDKERDGYIEQEHGHWVIEEP